MDMAAPLSHGTAMGLRPVFSLVLVLGTAFALQGCIVRTAADIVTAPVKVVGGAVDMATTSQSEADEQRGRALRKQDEHYAQLDRSYRKDKERCERGDSAACTRAETTWGEIEALRQPYPTRN